MNLSIKKSQQCVTINVTEKVYSLATIYAASYVFLERAYVYLDKDANGRILVSLFAKNKKDRLKKLGMDFCNELVNYAHYYTSLKVNAEVMKTLVQRALFSASPSLVNDMGRSEIESLSNELQNEERKAHSS